MADEKLQASVTDNTLNINIKSSNAETGSMKPVMSINEALKTNNQQKQIKEAKKVDPTDLNKKKTEVKKDNKEEQGSKELEVLLEISQTLSSLKDATINFKTETVTSLKDITEQSDKKDEGKMFSSYLSEGFIESLQNRIAQRNLSEAISNAVETSFIDNISDEFLEKLKVSLNETIDESSYFIDQKEKTSNHSLLLEQNVASLKLVNDFLRETQSFIDNKSNPGEKTEKFEAMLEDNSKRNAEALQTNLQDDQINQLNQDLKEHWQQDKELKEKTKETLEQFNEDLNNSEEVVNDDKVSNETDNIDSKIDQDLAADFKNGKQYQETIEEMENNTSDVVLEELKEKFQINVDEIEGIEELLREKISQDKKDNESKPQQNNDQMAKVLENRLSNLPKQNLPAKEQQNTLVKKADLNKPTDTLTEGKISSMLSGKTGVNVEKNDLGKKQITDKSSIKTLSSKTDSSEKINKVEITNFKDAINKDAKMPQVATASGMNKQQHTLISDKQQNSMEKLVSDLKNVNMKSSQERIAVGGGKKHGASIVSLLNGISNVVGSFLNVFKKKADDERAAAAFKEKFGNKEKKDNFNISIKNKQTTKKENKTPEKKEGKSIWGWLIGLALGGLWAVTKFLGKGVLKALWSVTKLALKGIGKALLWLGKLLAKGLWKVLKWAGKLLWKGISKLGSLIGKVFGKIGGVIKRVVPKLFKSFMGVMKKLLGPIGKFFGKFLGKAFGIFKGALSKILGPIAKWIGKLISKLFGGLGGKLGDLGGKIFDKVGGKLFKKGGGLFKKVGGKAFGKVGGKLLSKGGGKVAAKAAGKVAAKVAGKAALRAGAGALKAIPGVGLVAGAAMAAFDAVDGWKNAASITGKDEKDLTTGDRAKAAGASVLSGLTFGLVSSQTMYKGINAVTSGAGKLFKKVGGGIGKLWKKGGGLKGIAKKAIKYSPIGLAATGAKKLFGWMTGSKKKEEAKKKKESLEKSIMMGRAITRYTPIVRLLKQIISLMGGETNEMKLLFDKQSNTLGSTKSLNSNVSNNNAKKINAATVQIETSKINSNVNENTIKPIGENVKNFNNEVRKLDIKDKVEMSKDDLNNPLNPKRYEIFLKLLKPVITAAISDYFALGTFNMGKSDFNAAKNLVRRDSTDEASKI